MNRIAGVIEGEIYKTMGFCAVAILRVGRVTVDLITAIDII